MGDFDDDILEEMLNEEVRANNDSELPNADEFKSLQETVESLQKEKDGLLQATQAERAKRQTMAETLNKMEGALDTILSQRQQSGMESLTESEASDARREGIPVTYDDDGNGWIDPGYIDQIVTPYAQEINDLKAQLEQSDANIQAQTAAQKVMNSIIGEDERYVQASGKYRAARKWVEDQVSGYARSHNVNGTINSGQALDHVFDDHLKTEFNQKFGEMDLIDVVQAEDSQTNFRRMLDNVAGTIDPNEDLNAEPKGKMDSRFEKVLKKPSSLGNQANAKAGELTVLERAQSMSSKQIEDLTDAQMDALLKLAGEEGF